jgi:hypothetical protein
LNNKGNASSRCVSDTDTAKKEPSGDLPAEAVRDPAAPHTADDGTRVSNREEVVGHGRPHAVLNGKQRNEVEGDEHASVDEEEGQAESEEAPLEDGLADALLRGLDLMAFGVVAGRVVALFDEKTRYEEDGDGDESNDSMNPGCVYDGEELVDDDGPEDAADRRA